MDQDEQHALRSQLPHDHEDRMRRALLSLNGLSVGDGFGDCFFTGDEIVQQRLELRAPPPPPWFVTDDSIMALSIVRCLKLHGRIDRNFLAEGFAREYAKDPRRGYGGTAHGILRAIGEGIPWDIAAGGAFEGQGSCGNGGAMRSAPIGAYFADDVARVVTEARASAEVTHAHPDGQTGAIAIALAAAWMVREGKDSVPGEHVLIEFVLAHLPQTDTYYRLRRALNLQFEMSPTTAASMLGNGSQVISSDTVPFCLWCVSRHPRDYCDALWATVSGLGDRDTTCAIVGGIVSLAAGREGIPQEWLQAREALEI